MNLQEIKQCDDSVWLHILKQKYVFDTELIKEQKDWLIKKAEESEQVQNNWNTFYQFLENTDRLSEKDAVMLIDLMDDIKNGLVK